MKKIYLAYRAAVFAFSFSQRFLPAHSLHALFWGTVVIGVIDISLILRAWKWACYPGELVVRAAAERYVIHGLALILEVTLILTGIFTYIGCHLWGNDGGVEADIVMVLTVLGGCVGVEMVATVYWRITTPRPDPLPRFLRDPTQPDVE